MCMALRLIKLNVHHFRHRVRSIKVDCITVSTASVKSTIDDLIQQLFDALLNSLRRSTIGHIQTIDMFVTDGMEALSSRPQTVEEIGFANSKHQELSGKIPEVSLYGKFCNSMTSTKYLYNSTDLTTYQQGCQ